MNYKAVITVVILVLLTGFLEACSTQDQHEAKTDTADSHGIFKPDLIERSHSVQVNAEPDEVFRLFAPTETEKWSQRRRYFETQKLISGADGDLSGYSVFLSGSRGQIWSSVAKYDKEERLLRKIEIYPGIKFQVSEYRCVSNPNGGTTLIATWKVTGMTTEGNEAVRNFMDSGMFESVIDGLAKQLNDYLAEFAGN